jgi:hypothetical protein
VLGFKMTAQAQAKDRSAGFGARRTRGAVQRQRWRTDIDQLAIVFEPLNLGTRACVRGRSWRTLRPSGRCLTYPPCPSRDDEVDAHLETEEFLCAPPSDGDQAAVVVAYGLDDDVIEHFVAALAYLLASPKFESLLSRCRWRWLRRRSRGARRRSAPAWPRARS